MGFLVWPGGASQLKRVDPRTERVAGEGSEEAFFSAVTMGHDGAAAEVAFENGPEGEQGRGVTEVIGGDSVDLASGPGNVLLALEEGDEGRVDVVCGGPSAEADLNRSISPALGSASGLEVDGGENGFGDLDGDGVSQSGAFEKKMLRNQLGLMLRGWCLKNAEGCLVRKPSVKVSDF